MIHVPGLICCRLHSPVLRVQFAAGLVRLLQLGLKRSDFLLLVLLLLQSQHLVLVLQPDELLPETTGQLESRVRTRRAKLPGGSVAHLYSMGINSAARLAWPGLSAGETPTRKESECAHQVGRLIRTRTVSHWCITCLGELLLLGLAATQLLVDLLQRLALHYDPLMESKQI